MKNDDKLDFRFEDDQHFSLLDSIKQLLRAGRVQELDELLTSSEYYRDVEHIFFNDVELAITSFEYMWAQASYIAIEEGVDAIEAGHVYETYRRRLMASRNTLDTLKENRDFHHALAVLVGALKEEAPYSQLVKDCRELARQRILEPPTVQSIAEELGVSRGHLSSLFRKETGQTLQEFIRALRLDAIMEYLEDPAVPSSEVWQMTGFCSQSHYIQFFRQMTGKTPREFQLEYAQAGTEDLPQRGDWLFQEFADSKESELILKQLDDYAESGGFKQQLYQLYCVRKGRVEDLREELEDRQFQKSLSDIFQNNRALALETLLYLLPQISAAAVDGGVSMKSASRVYIEIIRKTPTADCGQLLQLLSDAYLAYAKLVAENES